ncbi:MAG: penicillin-binding protein activator [Thermodesulfobacteriota bacterium]
MISPLCRHSMRAVPVLAAGVALLLLVSGCQPKAPRKEPEPALKPPGEERFQQARRYERLGDYQRAYEAYRDYLQEHPKGVNSRPALYAMGRIRYGDGRFQEALTLFQKVFREYPSHPEQPLVGLDILSTLCSLGEFERCRSRGESWLKKHAGHPLEGDALYLLGKCEADAGRPLEAFPLWTRAAGLLPESSERAASLDEAVRDLIEGASLIELEAMGAQRDKNPYLPDILHHTASLHEEQGDLMQAKKAAMDLLEITSDPDWRLKAKRILGRIDKELSVRKGRIGCLLPLSGPFAIYGQETLKGIQAGVAHWLSGPGDREIELLIRDTRGDAESTVRAVEELAQKERVMAIIGPLSSRAAEAGAAKAQELGVPIITMAQKEGLPSIGDMVFRNFLTPSMEVKALLDHAFHRLGMQRFGIIYPDNPYGRHFMNLFWDRVEELGGTITAVESYPPDKTDYSDEVRKMVGLYYPRPASVTRMVERMRVESGLPTKDDDDEPPPIVDFDAVFLPDNSERVALIAPQFPFHRVVGIRLLGTGLWQSKDLIKLAGDYVQGCLIPSGFFKDTGVEPAASFVEHFRASFENEPDQLAANGYDTIQYLKNILADKRIITRNDLKHALWTSEGMAGVTGEIRFDKGGEVLKEPLLLTVKGRRFLPVVPDEEPWGDPASSRLSRE